LEILKGRQCQPSTYLVLGWNCNEILACPVLYASFFPDSQAFFWTFLFVFIWLRTFFFADQL
jgi:hypothetical protein